MGCVGSRDIFESTLEYFCLEGAIIEQTLNTFTAKSARIKYNNSHYIYTYNKLFCSTSLQTNNTIYRNKSTSYYFSIIDNSLNTQRPHVYARIWNSENGQQKELRLDLMFLNFAERQSAHKLLHKCVGSSGYTLPPLNRDGKVMIFVNPETLPRIKQMTESLLPNIVIWNDFSHSRT